MNTYIYSPEFKEKINYISSLNNEECKFLCNIYSKLTTNSNDNVTDYLCKNNCTFSETAENIAKICLDNNSVIFELSSDNEETQKFHAICKQNNITHMLVMSLTSKDIQKLIISKPHFNIFLNIDISLFAPWYNWDCELENKFNNMLNRLNNLPLFL